MDPFQSFLIRQLFRFVSPFNAFAKSFVKTSPSNSTYIYIHTALSCTFIRLQLLERLKKDLPFSLRFHLSYSILLVDSFARPTTSIRSDRASVVVPLIPRIMKLINRMNTARP